MKKYFLLSILLPITICLIFVIHLADVSATRAAAPLKFESCKPKKNDRHFLRMAKTAGAIPPPMPVKSSPANMPKTSVSVQKESASSAPSGEKKEIDVHQAGKKVSKEIQKASELYLSNDDSMSLASAQRILYVIDNFLVLYREQVRPHELLNYFHFDTAPLETGKLFSVKANLANGDGNKGTTLSFAVQGEKSSKDTRQNAVITLIIDRSGSMSDQGKMEYLKAGLSVLKGQFKKGDVLNIIEFDHELCDAIESFSFGRDSISAINRTISELVPRGSTNLHDALVAGYKLANKHYDPSKINRVILITDALANTGELSEALMSSISKYYDTKKIALSGIGVGQDFNDSLLNELTERGRGAYLFLGSKDATSRVFGPEFVSLLKTIARDVHFKATFPKGVHLEKFYGEEVATSKDKIQPINYFANTSQLFLLDLKGEPKSDGIVGFEISYKDPDSDKEMIQKESFKVEDINKDTSNNITKARIIMTLAETLEKTAASGSPRYNWWITKFTDSSKQIDSKKGKELCKTTLKKIGELADNSSDSEISEVIDLTNKYCSRF